MLSLMDSAEIEGLVVFRDDEVPNKFYALPHRPLVPLDELGRHDFLFIKYLKDLGTLDEGEEVGGGYVQFRSSLDIGEERKAKLVAGLRQRLEDEKAAGRKPFGLTIDSTEPQLASPLWKAGSVNLITFRPSEDGLVRYVPESRPVDLAGDLGASFALELDPDAAEIFWSAFEDPEQRIPIMISYELTFLARVTARLSIEAKRETITQRIQAAASPYELVRAPAARWIPFKTPSPISLAQFAQIKAQHARPMKYMARRRKIRQVIEKSISESEIKVTIDTSEMGSDAAADVQKMMLTLATEVLADRLVPALFGDKPDEPGSSSGADSTVDTDLVEVETGIGGSGDATFSLQLEQNAVVDRHVNPNGPLQMLIADPDSLDGCFRELRLTDGFFSEMRVTAQTAGVNFEKDGIDLVKLEFEYEQLDEKNPDRPMIKRSPGSNDNTILRAETDLAHWRFDTARASDGSHKREYRYRFEVHYREGEPRMSEWRTGTDRQLVITPGAMGALRVELALTAPPEIVRSARVGLKHETRAGRVYEAERSLTAGGERPVWLQYTGDVAAPGEDLVGSKYSYRVTYDLGDHTFVTPWAETRSELLEVPNPFRKTLKFNLRPQGSFDGIASIVGDFIYEDDANGYTLQKPFAFSGPADVVEVVIPILEGGPESGRWTARIVEANGGAQDLSGGPVAQGSVWIGGETSFIEVRVLPDVLDFAADIRLAIVTFTYDGGNGPEKDVLTFSGPDEQTWRAPRSEGSQATYDVEIRYIAHDRSRNATVTLPQQSDEILLLDPPVREASPAPAPTPSPAPAPDLPPPVEPPAPSPAET